MVESTEVPDVFSKLFLIEFISAVFGVSHLSKSNSFLQCVSFLLPITMGQGAYLLLGSPLYFCELLLYGNDTAPQILPCTFML